MLNMLAERRNWNLFLSLAVNQSSGRTFYLVPLGGRGLPEPSSTIPTGTLTLLESSQEDGPDGSCHLSEGSDQFQTGARTISGGRGLSWMVCLNADGRIYISVLLQEH